MRCEVSGSWPRPFAVGVLVLDGDPPHGRGLDDVRRRERLDLALDAYKLGYFLIDTVEVLADRSGYAVAETLAGCTDADAFVVRGRADLAWLERAATRLRMRVCHPGPPGQKVGTLAM